jgi:putative membrane protein
MMRAAFVLLGAVMATGWFAPASAGQRLADPARTPDAAFVAKAADAAAADIELAADAVRRASATAVKALAQRVLESRRVIGRDLEGMAGRRQIASAERPDPHKRTESVTPPVALRTQSPAAFDAAFLAAMAANTEAAVALFEAESRDGRDDEIKDWAARQLPALRDQLTAIRALRARPAS